MLGNTTHAYGFVSRLLHWIMVPLVWALFGVGLYMTSLGYYHPWYHAAPWWHKSFGLLTLMLLVIRLGWALIQHKPLPLTNHAPWEMLAARIAHALMYQLLLLVCVTGYLIATLKGQGIEFFGGLDIPAVFESLEDPGDYMGRIHFWSAVILVILSLLHALAAFKHHFVDRDTTLKRMLG